MSDTPTVIIGDGIINELIPDPPTVLTERELLETIMLRLDKIDAVANEFRKFIESFELPPLLQKMIGKKKD